MKKYLILIISLVLCLGLIFLIGCKYEANNGEDSPPHTCEYSTVWSYDESSHYRLCACNKKTDIGSHEYGEGLIVFEENDYVYRQRCKTCEHKKDGYVNVIYSENDCYILQNSINYIAPTVNRINEISIISGYSNITIIADNVVVEKLTIGANCSNIKIVNIDFSAPSSSNVCGGVYFVGSASTITLNDCSFLGGVNISCSKTHLIDKLTVNNSSFSNIANNGNSGVLTAIYLSKVKDFTINGCSFDTIQYSAINVGNEGGCVEGTLSITNNTFKNTTSRPLRFSGTSNGLVTVINGNTFNTLICSENQYVKSDIINANNELVKIIFGINKFENTPNESNFNGNVEINLLEQMLI